MTRAELLKFIEIEFQMFNDGKIGIEELEAFVRAKIHEYANGMMVDINDMQRQLSRIGVD